jgi:amino acid transporter
MSNIAGGGVSDYLFKILFVWASISSAIISVKIGKWIPTLGAWLKVALVAFFALTVLIYGFEHGFQGLKLSQLSPTSAGLLAIAPLILFSFVGFEGQRSR